MGQNCNKSPQSYSKVTIKLTVINNNRRFVNFFVLFVIYGQNTMDKYVMMNAPREVKAGFQGNATNARNASADQSGRYVGEISVF